MKPMTGEWQRLEAALVCIRDPLSRISLAVSRLDDMAANGDLVSKSIQDAVSEIDIRIEDTLSSLRPKLGPGEAPFDVRHSVTELARALQPVLGARGIELRLDLPDEQVVSDASLVRRIVCRLLLGVGRWMNECTGSVELTALRKEGFLGIRVDARVTSGSLDGGRRDVLGPLRGFALGEDLQVEGHEDSNAGHARVTVWLGCEAWQ
jgi:hypothetical protein